MILVAQDVAQDGDLVAFFDQAHGDAGHWLLDRNAAVHHRQGRAADRRHRARAVGLEGLADDPDGVGKFLVGRDHARDGALGQGAVTDLTPARAAHGLGLAGAEGREVVVKHEALPRLTGERVDLLLVGGGAEGGGDDGLGLTALEQRRAVHAGQEPDVAGNRTDGAFVATVDALPLLGHHLADDVVLALLELLFDELLEAGPLLVADLGLDLRGHGLLELAVAVVARLLLFDDAGRRQIAVDQPCDLGLNGRVELGDAELTLGLADRGAQLLDQLDDLLAFPVRVHQRVDDVGLGGLVSPTLDHDDGVLGNGHHQIDVRLLALLEGRIHDELSVDAGDADAAHRSVPGDVGDVQRGAGAGQRQDVGGVLVDRPTSPWR